MVKQNREFKVRLGKVAAASLAAALALTTVACSTGEEGSPDASQQDASGGTLTIGQSDQIMNLDPFTVPIGGRETRAPKRQIFDTLVVQDDQFVPQPSLATSWENPDDNTWVFALRDDVEFHNGEKFNSETMKENIDLLLDPAGGSPAHEKFLTMVESVETPDEFTFVINTTEPAPTLLTQLAFQEIVPTKHRAEVGGEAFNQEPVGTGPFSFVSQTKEEVVLEANQNYWGEVPVVEKVTFKHIQEVSSRIAALQSGEVDIIDQVPGDLAGTLTGKAEPVAVDGTRVYYVGMNVEEAPFDDVEVRRAANQATDTDALAEFLYDGNAIALNQPGFPTMFGYNENADVIPFDQEAARKVFETIDEPVTLYVTNSDATLAQAVVGQWQDAGLSVSIQTLEDEAFLERRGDGDLELFVSSWGVAEGDLEALNTRHFWSERSVDSAFTNYSNPKADELIVAGRTTIDEEVRLDAYWKLIDILIQDAPWVPLVTPGETYGVSSTLAGWEPSPTGQYRLTSVSVN